MEYSLEWVFGPCECLHLILEYKKRHSRIRIGESELLIRCQRIAARTVQICLQFQVDGPVVDLFFVKHQQVRW